MSSDNTAERTDCRSVEAIPPGDVKHLRPTDLVALVDAAAGGPEQCDRENAFEMCINARTCIPGKSRLSWISQVSYNAAEIVLKFRSSDGRRPSSFEKQRSDAPRSAEASSSMVHLRRGAPISFNLSDARVCSQTA
jgi:hypothetical protein